MTMTIEPEQDNRPRQFFHKPIPVEAMRILPGNIQSVARWCGGKVKGETVQLRKPNTKSDDPFYYARYGSYIVRTHQGYTAMTASQFENKFVLGER